MAHGHGQTRVLRGSPHGWPRRAPRTRVRRRTKSKTTQPRGRSFSLQPTSKGDGLLAVTGDSRLLFYGSGEVEDRDEEDEEEDDRDDEEEGKIVIQKELIGNTDEIIAAAFLPLRDGSKHGSTSEKVGDGKPALNALAVATNSSLLRVFDPSTMSCTAALAGHSGAILSLDVAVGPNGESLV